MIIEYLTEMTAKQVNTKIVTISLLLLISSFVFAFDNTSFANSPNETLKVSHQNKDVLQSYLLITHKSAGPLRLGMTIAQARKALRRFKFSQSNDGDGVPLIAVTHGNQLVMTIYTKGEISKKGISERAKIDLIRIFDKSFITAAGVHVETPMREVEKEYGTVVQITMSEIESREFAIFTNHPHGIEFQLASDSGIAGIYSEGTRRTMRYQPSAYVQSIWVTGRGNHATQFSSAYTTDLMAQCKNPT